MFDWNRKKPNTTPSPSAFIKKGMTLDEARLSMLGLLAEESVNHHRMGQLFNYVVDNQLAEKAGFKNAPDYFAKHVVDLSRTALMMYGAVAAVFTEEQARRLGVTCLYLLLTYTEAADLTLDHDAPGSVLIEVPGNNGAVESKPFSACSVDEMRKALQRKRKPASSKPLPDADIVQADAYREAVVGLFARGTPVRVQVRNHKGKAVVDFRGIPLDQVARLGAVLVEPPAQLSPTPQLAPEQQENKVLPLS